MIRNILVEERSSLSGYESGDLEKIQACLAEVTSEASSFPFSLVLFDSRLLFLFFHFSGVGPGEWLPVLVQEQGC